MLASCFHYMQPTAYNLLPLLGVRRVLFQSVDRISRRIVGAYIVGGQGVDVLRLFFFSSRKRHTIYWRDWSSDVCSSDLEVNPRVSRSSALASKATGFPIAKVAARLAVGYTLDEIANDITGGATPASFEPTIDYVVTKVPRFAFEKFRGAEASLSTSMKSVGEVMAIGRCFAESLQKALRGLETGLSGLDRVRELEHSDPAAIESALARQTPDRLLVAAEALRHGFTVERINAISAFDPWFLERLAEIVRAEEQVRELGLPQDAGGM